MRQGVGESGEARSSALWGTRSGERPSPLWSKGGRAAVLLAIATLALVLPNSGAAESGSGKVPCAKNLGAVVATDVLSAACANPARSFAVIVWLGLVGARLLGLGQLSLQRRVDDVVGGELEPVRPSRGTARGATRDGNVRRGRPLRPHSFGGFPSRAGPAPRTGEVRLLRPAYVWRAGSKPSARARGTERELRQRSGRCGSSTTTG